MQIIPFLNHNDKPEFILLLSEIYLAAVQNLSCCCPDFALLLLEARENFIKQKQNTCRNESLQMEFAAIYCLRKKSVLRTLSRLYKASRSTLFSRRMRFAKQKNSSRIRAHLCTKCFFCHRKGLSRFSVTRSFL